MRGRTGGGGGSILLSPTSLLLSPNPLLLSPTGKINLPMKKSEKKVLLIFNKNLVNVLVY
jgi:hypothetical protein